MNKDIILIITPELGGGGGCVFYRVNLIANYINANPVFNTKVIVSCVPLFDPELLARTKAVLIQRPMSPMPFIKSYRELAPKYAYKVVGEVDDLWTEWQGTSLPDYHPNAWQKRDYNIIDKIVSENLSYLDAVIVTTDELKRVLNIKYNFWNVHVIPNAAPRGLFNGARKDFFREKPVCIIPSGKQHYSEPLPFSQQFPAGKIGNRGDYTGSWVDWINDKVSNNEIDLTEMAGTAYFFDRNREKIQTTTWFDGYNYIGYLNRTKPDIVFAPLSNNPFNWCKSSLKFSECCAMGAILMGSYFEKSPYEPIHPYCRVPDNPSKEQLDIVFKNIKEHYKEIIDWQYEFINRNGLWLESDDHVRKFLTACSEPNKPLI